MSSTSSAVMSDALDERDAEEQVERDGRADHFGEVARGDGDFGKEPEAMEVRRRVVSRQACARSRPVAMPSLSGERLEEDRHQVGEHDDAESRV